MPPGSLHESVVIACSDKAATFRHAVPDDYLSRISIHHSTTFKGFHGAYSGSSKVPALAIVDNNGKIPRIVFEIGSSSESYNDLKEVARLWLEGMPGVQE